MKLHTGKKMYIYLLWPVREFRGVSVLELKTVCLKFDGYHIDTDNPFTTVLFRTSTSVFCLKLNINLKEIGKEREEAEDEHEGLY